MDGFNTKAVRSRGRVISDEPLAPPIWQVADYAFPSAQRYADVIAGREPGQVYGRYGSPTLDELAATIAELEGAEGGWVFSSGMAAIHAAISRFASSGRTVLAGQTLYGGTYGLLVSNLPRSGIDVAFFDPRSADRLPDDLGRFACVIVESVANPTFELADLPAIAGAAKDAGVPFIVDNTVPTPYLLNPLEHGATLVVHSASKYLGGHHDLMSGAILGPSQHLDEIRQIAIAFGTTASALECWLTQRGIATLGLRMERQSSSASALADVLAEELDVSYPGLPMHPQHDLATKLLRGYGAMLAIDLQTQQRAWEFMDSLRVARIGSSFGGVRSQVSHPASTSHRQFSKGDLMKAGISEGLVRVSVGLEDPDDLIEDLVGALKGS